MSPLLPAEVEKVLSGEACHLIIPSSTPELRSRLAAYLRGRGVEVVNELVFTGLDGQPWLLISLAQAYAGALILELMQQGFPQRITGIDAKPPTGAV